MLIYFIILVLNLISQGVFAKVLTISEISLLSVDSAITPATHDYLKQNFDRLPETSLVLLKLNTPGGLVTTTKDIITMIGEQKRPFVVWITPEGASASSAGAIIASAAHFLFMAPGTNMGAATPIGLEGEIKEGDVRKKALNDLSALVRSLSELRGRPPGPFEKMITGAESFTDQESLKLKIINGIASKPQDIISKIRGSKINLQGVLTEINIPEVPYKVYDPTPGQKILEVLANPSTAYILFMLGLALLYFEFQAPGGFIAGALGVCFLILAAISFQVLPLNWGALALIFAGVALLVLEIFIISYGILSLSGIAAFIMGSLFLFHGEKGFISIEYPLIISSLLGILAAIGIVTFYLIRDKKKQKIGQSFFVPEGATGTVITKDQKTYQVKVRGEIWKAVSEEDFSLGEEVQIANINEKNLTVHIKKISSHY